MAKLLGPFQIAMHRIANSENPVSEETPRVPFAVTFEHVFAVLERWPRMYIEPDGSFVWVGQEPLADGGAWQLDGHLYDRAERLLYVELQGSCPATAFAQILAACEIEPAEILIAHRQAGTIQRGTEFLANVN